MYQVSERVKKQFEYTMSIPCVKEAMKFIQEDERNNLKPSVLKMFTLTAVEMLLALEEEAAKDRRY